MTTKSTLSNLEIIHDDLLRAVDNYSFQYICHQTNCLSTYAKGVAAAIFDKYPQANVYAERTDKLNHRDRYARISVHDPVINLYGQIAPGKPNPDPRNTDNARHRLGAFKYALMLVGKIEGITSVALPFGIGCGLAGGNWAEYERAIERFAANYPSLRVGLFQKR